MSTMLESCPPVLSCAAAGLLEQRLFSGDEAKEWQAMQGAGAAVGRAVLRDAHEIGGFPGAGRVLVLVGKGHNGGDALIATRCLLEAHANARADVLFPFGERNLRPLAARAWRELVHAARDRVSTIGADAGSEATASSLSPAYDLCLDGIFGFQFRPPVAAPVARLIAAVNTWPIRIRAAVDLPSADLFRADFTYATGSVKEPLLSSEAAGRIRYLDLGFFNGTGSEPAERSARDYVLTTSLLDPLRALRPVRCDKRSYGHVFVVGGSRGFPGAILMSAMAAVRSGAGLVTAFVPESLAPAFAARLPEAIWVGWPETPEGGLALEGEHLLRTRIDRADALVIGPGIGREPETLAVAQSIVESATIPIAIDADALQGDIVTAGKGPRVVTPHAGEFKRIAGDADLRSFAGHANMTVVLKGPITRVCAGAAVYHSFFGGPVLARGGSGDLLSGMLGAQLAQAPFDPLGAAARAVVWHGLAADLLARTHGQVAVATTQALDHLEPALREP